MKLKKFLLNLKIIAISSFNNAKKADLVNEKRPEFSNTKDNFK